MKKITFLLIITLLLSLIPLFLNAQDKKLDSVQTFKWDDLLLPDEYDWFMQFREHYSYDNGGTEFTNRTSFNKDNDMSIWINNSQQIRTFNAQDKLETEIYNFWNGTDWVNSTKLEYSYDGSGNNDITEYYNHDGSNWALTSKDVKVFNGSDLVTKITSQSWSGMGFENAIQTRYTYSSDLLTEESHYNWNLAAMPQDWYAIPYLRNTYNYTGTLIDNYLTEVDQGSGLENSSFVENTYDGDNLETVIVKIWNADNDEWDNSSQHEYTYDMDNLITELITYTFIAAQFPVLNFKANPYWSDVTFSTESNSLSLDRVYPNPFKSTLNIKLKSALEYDGELKIFDVHGKEISKTELSNSTKTISINNPSLAKGLYIIKVISNSEQSVFKVLKH